MILRILFNKRLCYSHNILLKLFDRSPVVIARQWTVTTHGEAAAAGLLV